MILPAEWHSLPLFYSVTLTLIQPQLFFYILAKYKRDNLTNGNIFRHIPIAIKYVDCHIEISPWITLKVNIKVFHNNSETARTSKKKTITHLWMLIFSIERDHCRSFTRELDLDTRIFVQVLCAINQLEMRISPKKIRDVWRKNPKDDVYGDWFSPSDAFIAIQWNYFECYTYLLLLYLFKSNTWKMLVSWKWWELGHKVND